MVRSNRVKYHVSSIGESRGESVAWSRRHLALCRRDVLIAIALIAQLGAACSLALKGRGAGDGSPAIHAAIDGPVGLAVIDGVLYVAEMQTSRIRRIDLATDIISTLPTSRTLDGLFSVSDDGRGRLLIVEHQRISRIDPGSGVVTTLAGSGMAGDSGDGGLATAATLRMAHRSAADRDGNVYIAEAKRIRRVDSRTGVITTFAGTGEILTSGDGGSAASAAFEFPNSVAMDGIGSVYISQYGDDPSSHRIRRVEATGLVTTIAGPASIVWLSDATPQSGIRNPSDLTYDHRGGLLFLDAVGGMVFRVELSTGTVRLIAGGGTGTGDGAATAMRLDNPSGLAVGADGAVYVGEYTGNRVRRIDVRNGTITTVGGNGKPRRNYVIL
jgi:hypothetical protein